MVHFLDVGMLSFAAPNHGYWLLPFTVKGGRNQTPVFPLLEPNWVLCFKKLNHRV